MTTHWSPGALERLESYVMRIRQTLMQKAEQASELMVTIPDIDKVVESVFPQEPTDE